MIPSVLSSRVQKGVADISAGGAATLVQQPDEPSDQDPQNAHGRHRPGLRSAGVGCRGSVAGTRFVRANSGDFIYQELKRQASWQEEPVSFSHFRDKDKVEVDFVLESRGKLAGIEVKASSSVTLEDFKGLYKLQHAVQQRFAAGLVLYDGEAAVPFGENLYAVPISTLWERISESCDRRRSTPASSRASRVQHNQLER